MVSTRVVLWAAFKCSCVLAVRPHLADRLTTSSTAAPSLPVLAALSPTAYRIPPNSYSTFLGNATYATTTPSSLPSVSTRSRTWPSSQSQNYTTNLTRPRSLEVTDDTVTPSTTSTQPDPPVTSPPPYTLPPSSFPPPCTTIGDADQITVWEILPNTDTVTITLGLNSTASFASIPEFTPPTYCATGSVALSIWDGFRPTSVVDTTDFLPTAGWSTERPEPSRPPPITIIITSKNPVTLYTSAAVPTYPSGDGRPKHTVTQPINTDPVLDWGTATRPLVPNTGRPTAVGGSQEGGESGSSGAISAGGSKPGNPSTGNAGDTHTGGTRPGGSNSGGGNLGGNSQASTSSISPETFVVAGVIIILTPDQVVIGDHTVKSGEAPTQVIQNGQTFTVNPTQVLALGATFNIPTPGPSPSNANSGLSGASTVAKAANPTTQVITAEGVTFSEIGPSLVVIGASTFTVGPDVKPTTQVYNGQTISIGTGGIGFSSTTVPVHAPQPTKKNGDGRLTPALGSLEGVCAVIWAIVLRTFLL